MKNLFPTMPLINQFLSHSTDNVITSYLGGVNHEGCAGIAALGQYLEVLSQYSHGTSCVPCNAHYNSLDS